MTNVDVRTDAELRKLAKTLDTDPERVSFLGGIPAEDVAALRRQVADSLFRADKHLFARVAALSKSVPTAIAAKLTEAALPPLLAARTTELIEPAKAAELVGKLSDRYLADVSVALDASRAPKVVAAIPTRQVVSVSAELARREEWVVIGGFVSHVSEDGLRASIGEYTGEQLLRIAFVTDDLARLDQIVSLLGDAQLNEVIAAGSAHGLWQELTTLVDELSDDQLDRLAARYANAPESVRAEYDRAVEAGQLRSDNVERLRSA